jgi:hypothetical protein
MATTLNSTVVEPKGGRQRRSTSSTGASNTTVVM